MPTRYLKPGICDSSSIDSVSPEAERLYYRLLVNVDDFGRMDARLPIIKARCFPLKEEMKSSVIEKWLKELAESGLTLVYICMDEPFLQFTKWDNKPRASESKFPAFDDTCIQMYTDVPLTETVTETKTVTDKRASKARPSSPDEVTKYASSIGFDLDGQYFIDFNDTRGWKLKGGQLIKDWKACVRTWKNNNQGKKQDRIQRSGFEHNDYRPEI